MTKGAVATASCLVRLILYLVALIITLVVFLNSRGAGLLCFVGFVVLILRLENSKSEREREGKWY